MNKNQISAIDSPTEITAANANTIRTLISILSALRLVNTYRAWKHKNSTFTDRITEISNSLV